MIAIVRIALQRPYTFVVLAVVILIAGPLAALRTPVDIFPEIRIPVIAVIWQYTGLQPDQMAGRITTQFQRALTTTVNDIEHIESQSLAGIAIIKVFFQPNANIQTALAQVVAIEQAHQLPVHAERVEGRAIVGELRGFAGASLILGGPQRLYPGVAPR